VLFNLNIPLSLPQDVSKGTKWLIMLAKITTSDTQSPKKIHTFPETFRYHTSCIALWNKLYASPKERTRKCFLNKSREKALLGLLVHFWFNTQPHFSG